MHAIIPSSCPQPVGDSEAPLAPSKSRLLDNSVFSFCSVEPDPSWAGHCNSGDCFHQHKHWRNEPCRRGDTASIGVDRRAPTTSAALCAATLSISDNAIGKSSVGYFDGHRAVPTGPRQAWRLHDLPLTRHKWRPRFKLRNSALMCKKDRALTSQPSARDAKSLFPRCEAEVRETSLKVLCPSFVCAEALSSCAAFFRARG
jgi:hypothetical protein